MRLKRNTKLYLELSRDELSLIVGVYDSASEMARALNMTLDNVCSQVCKGNKGQYKYPRFISVEIEEVDD